MQLENFTEKREKLLQDYKFSLEFNKTSIEKITYLNNKLGKNNNNNYYSSNYHSNSTVTFLSLKIKKEKQILAETIENNIKNSYQLYELEKEICLIDSYIHKTKENINLNI